MIRISGEDKTDAEMNRASRLNEGLINGVGFLLLDAQHVFGPRQSWAFLRTFAGLPSRADLSFPKNQLNFIFYFDLIAIN